MRHAAIVATGSHIPERAITNDDLRARLGPSRAEIVDKLERSSGIFVRYAAPENWVTSDLAVAAAHKALARAGLDAMDLDMILLGSDSPDYPTPATSVVVQAKLGARRAGTFDVGCACASFPTALATAAGLIATQRSMRNILVVGAYLMRRLADPLDPISFFYGDGAGAAVVSASDEPGLLGAAFRADGRFAKHWCIASGGTVEPSSEASVRAGRTRVVLHERYPDEVNEEGWPALIEALGRDGGFGVDDVDHAIFTQVRRTTIERVAARVGLPIDKAHMIMQRCGYTGSACIPMALDDALVAGKLRAGQLVVMIGSGVGFNQAGIAMRVTRRLAGLAA